MDEAFKQHSRRKSGSANNPALSLAPLTSRLPIHDLDTEEPVTPTSQRRTYLEGKSAPTTPRLLSRSSTRTRLAPAHLSKSKSATHLAGTRDWKHERGVVSGTTTPRRSKRDDHAAAHGTDSDWLLRTGALMTSEAREYKGQAWLVSRASSTSLAATRDQDSDEDGDEMDNQLRREREFVTRHHSRRGSAANGNHLYSSPSRSMPHSRAHSRPGSRAGSRALNMETLTSVNHLGGAHHEFEDMPGPDFVNLDEQLEALAVEESILDDEAAVRRLVRRGHAGQDSWLANLLGWSLFSVEEDEDEEDSGDESDDAEVESLGVESSRPSTRYLSRLGGPPEERIPPPADEGGWKDAAWLLSVASRVVL